MEGEIVGICDGYRVILKTGGLTDTTDAKVSFDVG